MGEGIGYQTEELRAPVETDDWRLQEMLSMGPQVVMDELLTLSEAILDAKFEWETARIGLRDARERLKLMKAQVLQAALDSEDKDVSDRVGGKNAEERQHRAGIYLADHSEIKRLAFEVRPLENAETTTRLAMEALLDRQKNLHQWARMFEAQVNLLATVQRPVIEVGIPESILAAMESVVRGDDVAVVKAAVDELFPPDVEIPPSMGVLGEEVDAMKVAIERYGEKVGESTGPSL